MDAEYKINTDPFCSTLAMEKQMLSDSHRVHVTDKKFDDKVENEKFVNHLFVRLVAKGRRFVNVDFKY
jgi:hypothetical protein